MVNEFITPEKVKFNGKNYDVVGISHKAFRHVWQIKHIVLSAKICAIEANAFENSSIESVKRKSSSKRLYIGPHAFRNCINLKTVVFGGIVSDISDYAFYGCKNLKSLDSENIQDNTIASNVFSGCSALKYFCINVRQIFPETFDEFNFERVRMGSKVESIPKRLLEKWKDIPIECNETSKFVNLAFEGYHIQIVD